MKLPLVEMIFKIFVAFLSRIYLVHKLQNAILHVRSFIIWYSGFLYIYPLLWAYILWLI